MLQMEACSSYLSLLLAGISVHVLLMADAAGCPPDWWLRRRFCPAHFIYFASRAENTASVNDAILVSAGLKPVLFNQ